MQTHDLYERFHTRTGDSLAAAILVLADRIESTKSESLTVNEAAEHLACQPATVRAMCADGRLRHHRVGTGRGTIRIVRDDLDLFRRTRENR